MAEITLNDMYAELKCLHQDVEYLKRRMDEKEGKPADDEPLSDSEVKRMEELIEKSIKTGRIVSEEELFSSLK
ncbi:hypothetical protein HY572_02715 [Candidatus Micrarchaeota archaeon]|nr:hypothetical protein [Candidatus Micrarchaeota archaeon]